MILQRDETVLDWLHSFKVATSKQINSIEYFDINICNRRLKKMCENKILFRIKNPYHLGYIYSTEQIRNVKQLRHKLLRNEFYLALKQFSKIDFIEIEPLQYEGLKPDAVFGCLYQSKYYLFFVEIETSHNTINVEKYNNFFIEHYKNHFGTFEPTVVYVTNKHISKKAYFRYKQINLDLSNIANLFV